MPARSKKVLTTQSQSLDQGRVTVNVFSFQIIEQLTTGIHHTDKTAAGMMVVVVLFEVFLKLVDVGCQQCHLDFRGSGVTFC